MSGFRVSERLVLSRRLRAESNLGRTFHVLLGGLTVAKKKAAKKKVAKKVAKKSAKKTVKKAAKK